MAERKVSAPAAPLGSGTLGLGALGTDSPPGLKLRGGAPDDGMRSGRKVSSLSMGPGPPSGLEHHISFDAASNSQRFLPPASAAISPQEDEDLDLKLAHKLGIADSLSDGRISPAPVRNRCEPARHGDTLKTFLKLLN